MNSLGRLQSLWYGVTLPIESLRLILSKPRLILWSLLPLVLTLVLYFFLFSEMQTHSQILISHSIERWGLNPQGWAAYTLQLLTKILLFLASALTFSFVATLLACPFNDFLAEATERYSTPPLMPVQNQTFLFRIKTIGIDFLKTLMAAGISLMSILLSWIPFMNIAALFLTFMVICFQYISYPQTRRGLGVDKGIAFIWEYRFACFGFGAVSTFLLTIPFMACFFLPLIVVGGTLLVARAQKSHSLENLR